MTDLVLDGDEMSALNDALRQLAGGELFPPSASGCGARSVIDAFSQSFTLLHDQEYNVRSSWLALATRGDEAVEATEQADAALAGESA